MHYLCKIKYIKYLFYKYTLCFIVYILLHYYIRYILKYIF